jgi:hypothetical protein
MLTIFSVPKPFKGNFGRIQHNAIRSWTLLSPPCEVILFGNEQGTAEAAGALGLRHVSAVACNAAGTPLVSDMFAQAEKKGGGSLFCYVNSDIILLSDFLPSVQAVASQLTRFLFVGRRWDLQLDETLEFSPDWENTLRRRAAAEAALHPHTGIDYFVFPRGMWGTLPPFAVGRPAWDGSLIHSARTRMIPVVDATERVTAVHQNHDYSHHPLGENGVWRGPEAQHNLELAGGYRRVCTIRDATHQLTLLGLKARLFPYDLRRCVVAPVVTHPSMRGVVRFVKRAVSRGGQ